MNDNAPKLAAGILTVCGWCMPGNTVFERFPHYAGLGLTVSHGICPVCLSKQRETLAKLRADQTAVAPSPQRN